MKLIVGLGNPGLSYAHNRHNIGFICLRHFARKQGIKFDSKKCQARIGTGKVTQSPVVLARPQTYMNLSGQSVSRLVDKFGIEPDSLLVIHDDLDLPPGKIRISRGSGSGGHQGIASIISWLNSPDFTRIRVGIGRPQGNEDTGDSEAAIINYVLSDFTPGEKKALHQVIPRVSDAIYCLLTEGTAAAMNRYN
ncbi:MAG: aminoacyl-tRNA hydrolase [Chloroflexota bacterium]